MPLTWPTFKGTIGDDAVKVRRAVVTQDKSKGRIYTYGPWEQTRYAVAIVPATANEIDMFAREGVTVRFNVVGFQRLCKYRDQLQWQETGITLTVVSIRPSGTRSMRTWDHHCEEHDAG